MALAPGIVAIECIGLALYLIPLILAIRMLALRFNELRTTRKVFYVLIVMFGIIREIHISLNFARAERAHPFDEKQYIVRNNNMIIWTAVLGVYLLYSALMVIIYEWASLLTKANLSSHKKLTIIVVSVIVIFNLEYFALLTAHVEGHTSMEAIAYATIGVASIVTLIPALVYYFKIAHTLRQSQSRYAEKHTIILRKLGLIILPISLALVLRSGIAWAIAVQGNHFNFYVWIILFWMLPELVPVTIMLVAISHGSKPTKKSSVTMQDMRTPSTLHLQDTSENSNQTTKPSTDSGLV